MRKFRLCVGRGECLGQSLLIITRAAPPAFAECWALGSGLRTYHVACLLRLFCCFPSKRRLNTSSRGGMVRCGGQDALMKPPTGKQPRPCESNIHFPDRAAEEAGSGDKWHPARPRRARGRAGRNPGLRDRRAPSPHRAALPPEFQPPLFAAERAGKQLLLRPTSHPQL